MKLTVYFGVSLYSNRIIDEDLTNAEKTALVFDNINFIFGDGINTSQTLNGNLTNVGEKSPSYVKVENPDGTINSYWWVISTFQQNAKQITLTLRRDFLRQYWDSIKNVPFLVQKSATIPNAVSYAKYGKTMNLSQVKTEEVLLHEDEDTLGKGWLVFYFAKSNPESSSQDVWGSMTVGTGQYGLKLDQDHTHCMDSSSDIFVIPIGGTLNIGNRIVRITMEDLPSALDFAFGLLEHFGSWIYDIQYLPYTPIDRNNPPSVNIPIISGEFVSSPRNYGFWLSTAYFQKEITHVFEGLDFPSTNIAKRRFSEERMYRLCSPNFASSFEFNPIRNDGYPTFIVHGILKPYSPYIYVQPKFGGLYGGVFNDGRGMIFAGDYSLDQISSAWTEYKLQNKNYELAFNRQIESMDLKSDISEENANWKIVNSVIGSTNSILKGVGRGAILGGVGGAVVGGIGGAISGTLDIVESARNKSNTVALNNDAKDNAITQFQYQIGNIQAIPNTLTKVSAINQEFKIFPVIEVYDCTEEEKKNLNNSIRYNGIEINQVAELGNFDTGFVSGVLLQFPKELNINQEQSDAIQNELAYGIYIKEV